MYNFVDPKTLSRIKDLPLVAKTLAHGFLNGIHESTQRGVGIEFSQYRVYEPGDDLSKIDWKLFARSDKYFVREADRESDMNVWFILDTSKSMLQQSHETKSHQSWTKFEYARYLLATASYIAQKQGDSVGFLALSSNEQTQLPPLNGERHWQKVLIALARLQAGDFFPSVEKISKQLSHIRKRGVIFVISDFHQQNNELIELIEQLTNSRTEVVAIQLTCDDEEYFPYKGVVRFEDLETEEQILVSANQVKEQYFIEKHKYQSLLNIKLAENKVKHFIANIDRPLDQTLFDILSERNKVAAR